MPVKDLMNEVRINELNLNKISSKPNKQIGKTSISSESLSFPIEPQLSIGPRATHIILQNDTDRQAVINKLKVDDHPFSEGNPTNKITKNNKSCSLESDIFSFL